MTIFDLNLLNLFVNENGIELVGDYNKLTRESIINGKCKTENCIGEFCKTFRMLFKNKGFYCNNCQKKLSREKMKKTNLIKYGCEFNLHNKDIKQKRTNTFLEKYGGHPSANENIKQKKKDTYIKRYGVEHIMQLETFKNKKKELFLSKYGVEHQMHNPDFAEKMTKSSFSKKEFIMPSGKIIYVQGYEPFALTCLIHNQQIKENDILTGCKNVPTIWYNDDYGKKRRHYVDIFIPSLNKCVEVKSVWTMNYNTKTIFIKQNAAKEMGYSYEIWVYNKEGNRVELYT
jgi:hypothetical protein